MGFAVQPLIEFARAKIAIETLKNGDGYSVNELLLVLFVSPPYFCLCLGSGYSAVSTVSFVYY